MSGLRIHHPTLRNCTVGIPCPAVTPQGRDVVTHIVLDDDGNALVSEGVWEQFQRADRLGYHHGFIILNVVSDPPAQTIGFGGGVAKAQHRRTYLVERQALREIAPKGVVPRVVQKGLPSSINTKG